MQAIECALIGTQVRCARPRLIVYMHIMQLLNRNMVNKRLY